MNSGELYTLAGQWHAGAVRLAKSINNRWTNTERSACQIDAMFNIAEHLKVAAFSADGQERAAAQSALRAKRTAAKCQDCGEPYGCVCGKPASGIEARSDATPKSGAAEGETRPLKAGTPMTDRNTPTPSNSVIEARVIDELVAEGRSGRHMYNREQNEALDDEARAFYRKVISRYRVAMQSANSTGSDELVAELESDLQMLHRACKEGDPHRELTIRVEDALALLRSIVAPLNAIATPDTDRVAVLEEALEPFALLAGGDVNMNDPLRKWFTVAHLQAALAALSQPLGSQER